MIAARIKRLERGLFGEVESVGDGVSDPAFTSVPVWRISFARRNTQLIVLLAGGSKRTQKKDIQRAKERAASLD